VRIRSLIISAILCVFLSPAQQDTPPDPKFAALANQILTADAAGRAALLAAHKDMATPELVLAVKHFADQAFDRRDYNNALPIYQIAAEVAASVGDARGQAACIFDVGLSESRRFHPDEAIALYNQALSLYEKSGKPGDLVSPLNGIALVLSNRGDVRQAIPYYERALSDAADAGNEISIAQTNSNLGNLYHRLGNYTQSILCLQKALEIAKRHGLERETALVMNNLGGAYFDQHDLELALSYYEQSMAIPRNATTPWNWPVRC
jgi:tetratricopeptide (TPR) repeat protein